MKPKRTIDMTGITASQLLNLSALKERIRSSGERQLGGRFAGPQYTLGEVSRSIDSQTIGWKVWTEDQKNQIHQRLSERAKELWG